LRASPHRRGARGPGGAHADRHGAAGCHPRLRRPLARAGVARRGQLARAGLESARRPPGLVDGGAVAVGTEPPPPVRLPVYDEVENLPQLWSEIEETLGRLGLPAEIIFVDDASTDASADLIRGFMAADPRVRMVSLDPHAGLTSAFHAGFAAVRGRIVATLD